MTSPPQSSDDGLDVARAQLAGVARQRWVEVANDVLEKAMLANRHSLPVRAQATTGQNFVSEQVLIAHLRRAIDAQLQGAAVGRIALSGDRDTELRAVFIELFAQYGHDLVPLADRARAAAESTLRTVLGAGVTEVTVTALHVHFSDVTVEDPHLVDPSDP